MALYTIPTKDKQSWKSIEFNNQDHKHDKFCLLSAKFDSPLVPEHVRNLFCYALRAIRFDHATEYEQKYCMPLSGLAHNSSRMLISALLLLPSAGRPRCRPHGGWRMWKHKMGDLNDSEEESLLALLCTSPHNHSMKNETYFLRHLILEVYLLVHKHLMHYITQNQIGSTESILNCQTFHIYSISGLKKKCAPRCPSETYYFFNSTIFTLGLALPPQIPLFFAYSYFH